MNIDHNNVKSGPAADSGKRCDNFASRPPPAFYRIRDVLRITALSRPTLYRRIAAGRFPPPVHLGGRAAGWSAAALQAWIADPEGYRAPSFSNDNAPRGPGRPRKHL
jgi:prophage regulatory protein